MSFHVDVGVKVQSSALKAVARAMVALIAVIAADPRKGRAGAKSSRQALAGFTQPSSVLGVVMGLSIP